MPMFKSVVVRHVFFKDGVRQQRDHTLRQGVTEVGRLHGPFTCFDPSISRKHCHFFLDLRTSKLLVDCRDGTNKCFLVRGGDAPQRVSEAASLQNGDMLLLARRDGTNVETLEVVVEMHSFVTCSQDLNGTGDDLTQQAATREPESQGVPEEADCRFRELASPYPAIMADRTIPKFQSKQLRHFEVLAEGGTATVYKASLQGTPVVVKRVASQMDDALQKEFFVLSKVKHPYILQFLGVCVLSGPALGIVCEFLERGTLRQVLNDDTCPLPTAVQLQMAEDAAQGMNYLHCHAPVILHRDLKSENLLCDKSFKVKVADFGCSAFSSTVHESGAAGFTPAWAAPEVVSDCAFSSGSDVYSFGVVMWEIATRKVPFDGKTTEEVLALVRQYETPPLAAVPRSMPKMYVEWMERCWARDVSKRPAFQALIGVLEGAIGEAQAASPLPRMASDGMLATPRKRMLVQPTLDDLLMHTPAAAAATARAAGTPAAGAPSPKRARTSPQPSTQWLIPAEDIVFENGGQAFGSGTFASVHVASFRGQRVAVKKLKVVPRVQQEFDKEIAILAGVRSPSAVVYFYGWVREAGQYWIVTEFLPHGSLLDVLKRGQLTWGEGVHLLAAAARSLRTLHEWVPPVLHRDVKPANMLVTEHGGVKLCDFGLARFQQDDQQDTLMRVRGTHLYTAPELMRKRPASVKSDVYSFGLCVWEVCAAVAGGAHRVPFDEFPHLQMDFQVLFQVANNDLRPSIPAAVPDGLKRLIRACWDKDPDKRPTIADVCRDLDHMDTCTQAVEEVAFIPGCARS